MVKACRFLVWVGLCVLMVGCVPGALGQPASATPGVTPTAAALPAHLGQFDCYGQEAGLRAYAGRVTLAADGTMTFADQTGQWTYEAGAAAFTFSGSTDLGEATYQAGEDTLVVLVRPGSTVAHADDGRMDCVRAEPGVTGP
jgi:hypothetical protein